MAKPAHKESLKDLIAEHKRLVGVLKKPTARKLSKEAKIQGKELLEYIRENAQQLGIKGE